MPLVMRILLRQFKMDSLEMWVIRESRKRGVWEMVVIRV